nr:unnamed protein product [Trichobilharzia regenti]
MADTISKRFNFNEAEITFKGYITWISIDISFMLFIMISVMVLVGSIQFLQNLLLGKAYLSIIFALLAVDLYCTALFFEKIRQSVNAAHIMTGIVVLLLSVSYCCTYKQLFALIIFITLNATLALSVCIIFVAFELREYCFFRLLTSFRNPQHHLPWRLCSVTLKYTTDLLISMDSLLYAYMNIYSHSCVEVFKLK